MPIKKDGYLQLIPLLHVDHIHDIQDEQGVLKMALTFTFVRFLRLEKYFQNQINSNFCRLGWMNASCGIRQTTQESELSQQHATRCGEKSSGLQPWWWPMCKFQFSTLKRAYVPTCLSAGQAYLTYLTKIQFSRPNSRRPSDVFKPFDMDIYISSSGMVRTSARMMLTIPCRTGFGSYPNDYKNCTFTLMSPYYADQ